MVQDALKLSTESQKLVLWARKIVKRLRAELAREGEQRKLQRKRKREPTNGLEPGRSGPGVPSANNKGANTNGQAAELRAVEAVFATHGKMNANGNGNPPGHIYPPGMNMSSYTTPYAAVIGPQAASVDPQAAVFAAISQAPRQFSTFNSAPPPAGN